MTRAGDALIEVVDVEMDMETINGQATGVSSSLAGTGRTLRPGGPVRRVLLVDDSAVARNQICGLYVLLHSSLNGDFNYVMAQP